MRLLISPLKYNSMASIISCVLARNWKEKENKKGKEEGGHGG
jgi:hypothetical protein